MAKSKLRESWGGKVEAQGGLGVAKPNLTRASGVDLRDCIFWIAPILKNIRQTNHYHDATYSDHELDPL